jgi:P27 family predicted phage terminase small subunit
LVARGRKVTPKASSVADTAGEPGGGVEPPDGMTPRALAKWRQLVPMIQAMCQLRETDADALAAYCEASAARRAMRPRWRRKPLVLATPNGALQIQPALKIIEQAEAVMLKLSSGSG